MYRSIPFHSLRRPSMSSTTTAGATLEQQVRQLFGPNFRETFLQARSVAVQAFDCWKQKNDIENRAKISEESSAAFIGSIALTLREVAANDDRIRSALATKDGREFFTELINIARNIVTELEDQTGPGPFGGRVQQFGQSLGPHTASMIKHLLTTGWSDKFILQQNPDHQEESQDS